MACIVDPALAARPQSRKVSLWHRLSRVFRRRARPRIRRLDPRELPDHLKRDLGFLDGRG